MNPNSDSLLGMSSENQPGPFAWVQSSASESVKPPWEKTGAANDAKVTARTRRKILVEVMGKLLIERKLIVQSGGAPGAETVTANSSGLFGKIVEHGRGQLLPQPLEGPVIPDPHGAVGRLEELRDLLAGSLFDRAEHDHDAVVRIQLLQRLPHQAFALREDGLGDGRPHAGGRR